MSDLIPKTINYSKNKLEITRFEIVDINLVEICKCNNYFGNDFNKL